MFDFEKINLNLSYSSILFIIGIIIILLYSFYVYKYTLPPVLKSKRIFLAALRGSALILLLFIFFEPMLSLTKKEISEPVNLIFIDNSKSILIEDETDRQSTVKTVLEKIINSELGNTEFYTFGKSIESIEPDSIDKLDFSFPSTNFSNIFKEIEPAKRNISSVTIISDGVITDGTSPVYTAQQKAIPVFTIGIGDSSHKNDVEVKSVLFNDLIYAETPTRIMGTIINRGFDGQNVMASLYENDILVQQKNIVLEDGGTNTVYFDYTPETSGEKKLSLNVSELNDEFTFSNNNKIFFINVLSNKIKVLILSGSPSADLTFIKNKLSDDKNISVSTLTQIRNDQFIEGDYQKKIDSADIFCFIGFPTRETSQNVIALLINKISDKNIPIFFSLTSDVNITKLNTFQPYLPFTITQLEDVYVSVQPEIPLSETNNPLLLNSSSSPISMWNNLPPILQPRITVTPKPESKVISRIKVDNVPRPTPLILTRSLGKHRSIALLAKDYWKWKLQTASRNSDLFDSFIINSVRWLNISDEFKKVKINPVKKIFASGEDVEFIARVFDDALNPVSNSDVKIIVTNDEDKFEVNLNSAGNGLYEGSIQIRNPGDYYFKGEAKFNGNILGTDNGIFNIGEVDIEMINPRMDFEFLNLLSMETGGEYFSPEETNDLINELKNISSKAIKENFLTSEINLWSSEYLLILVILLFAVEWFIRKRAGML